MNQLNVKCFVCEAAVIFANDPYSVPEATRYWKSTYEEPEESMFIVQRKIPVQGKHGRVSVQVFNEHILKVYCGPECGLEDYGTT